MRREHTTCCKFGTHWGRVLAEKRVKRARAADSLGWCCGVLWAEGAEGGARARYIVFHGADAFGTLPVFAFCKAKTRERVFVIDALECMHDLTA
jgi:hypothetical protein